VAILALVYLFIPDRDRHRVLVQRSAGRFNLTWEGFTLDHWLHPFAVEGSAAAMRTRC
jgi:spermidine/putrescine transport system permease protein